MADVAALEEVLAEKQAERDAYNAAYRAVVKPLVAELDGVRADAVAEEKVAGLSVAEKAAFVKALEKDGN